jgi:hypothetical protein
MLVSRSRVMLGVLVFPARVMNARPDGDDARQRGDARQHCDDALERDALVLVPFGVPSYLSGLAPTVASVFRSCRHCRLKLPLLRVKRGPLGMSLLFLSEPHFWLSSQIDFKFLGFKPLPPPRLQLRCAAGTHAGRAVQRPRAARVPQGD